MSHQQLTQEIHARQRQRRRRTALATVTMVIATAALVAGSWPAPAFATVCADGWISSSTGPGTCSHHGGIYHGVPMVLAIPAPPPAPPSVPVVPAPRPVDLPGVRWLREPVVSLDITNRGTRYLCQGGIMGQQGETVYVVTARHCLEPMTGAGPIRVRTLDGWEDYATHWAGPPEHDRAVLWVTFPKVPFTWDPPCLTCTGQV
jgi:hypothetical protein